MVYWQALGWGGFVLALWLSRSGIGWQKFRSDKGYQHFVLASALILFCLWALKAGISEGLDIHFLGMTVLTLCHGPRIAIWISTLPLALMVSFGLLPLADVGLYAATTAVVPALISYAIFWLSYQYLSRHLFIYIFIAGFLNAAFTIVLHLCVVSAGYWISGLHSWDTIINNYLMLALLIWFPEGLLNGMAVSMMSVYRPHWMRTFYDREYLSPDR
ncbi:energy-coupling factor ABC transporter permease [Enterovibrio sp. ZSDZ35]|uniref:Energy-coupling factor ABC transporter permease n=1 Tax=Enterovibrio qingdaonensis TaxID=2899818 RepID=A0ABT5QKM7_9GAMM|nr:energy-coupling factor ABC transporter permease [Enterovibrio sp. ZSDZ35]MDD1781414.1 energy-coupling factor ABC transporter permease [Enterovibrio sp. ZSDZ35]